MMKVLNVYASLGGQTEKVAMQVEKAAKDAGCDVTTVNIKKDTPVLDLLSYDLTFIGSGVYSWLPGKVMLGWIDAQMAAANKAGQIQPNSPRVPGKFVSVYCTYGGPHTGEGEAIPAIKYMGQLFDHLGITVASEWSVPGAFVPEKLQKMNTCGRLGNIEGRPNANDLTDAFEKTKGLIESLRPVVEALSK